MTAPIIDETPSDPQGRAYTDGWRDYGMGRITSVQRALARKPYARGWLDHQDRDKCAAMYAAGRNTNDHR